MLRVITHVGGKEKAVVLIGISQQRHAHVVKLGLALDSLGGLLRARQRRQQKPDQDRHDSNDHQKFDQSKPGRARF